MAIEQFRTTGELLTFHNGALVPAGVPITIDTDVVEIRPADPKNHDLGNAPNIAPLGDAPTLAIVPVAALSPTGPNPVVPQQLPPGVYQDAGGYHTPDSHLVAEGSIAALAAAADVEEEPVRRAFDPQAVVDGNVNDVTARLDGLTREQLEQVRDAEQGRDAATRSTLTAAIDARIAALDAAA